MRVRLPASSMQGSLKVSVLPMLIHRMCAPNCIMPIPEIENLDALKQGYLRIAPHTPARRDDD